ncbi:hypothetical protein PDIDSM_1367 [Penicillium digitatum]|jgi:hypothetical protein|nr:hypothetical protein PDIDSM_1367 [Penicillium digitatum]
MFSTEGSVADHLRNAFKRSLCFVEDLPALGQRAVDTAYWGLFPGQRQSLSLSTHAHRRTINGAVCWPGGQWQSLISKTTSPYEAPITSIEINRLDAVPSRPSRHSLEYSESRKDHHKRDNEASQLYSVQRDHRYNTKSVLGNNVGDQQR